MPRSSCRIARMDKTSATCTSSQQGRREVFQEGLNCHRDWNLIELETIQGILVVFKTLLKHVSQSFCQGLIGRQRLIKFMIRIPVTQEKERPKAESKRWEHSWN